MKTSVVSRMALLAALAALAGLVGGALRAGPRTPVQTIVLSHVTVIDGSGAPPAREMAVVLSGGRIERVVAAAGFHPPQDAVVLDLPGRFVVPGFVEMHAHLLMHPWLPDGRIAPRFDRSATLRRLRVLLAAGITTVRDPGDETEAAVTLRNMIAEGKVLGPRVFTAGRILNDSTFAAEPFAPVHTAGQVREEVRWQAAAGVDFIKVYASMPPVLVRAAIEEAHAHGLPVIGHLQRTTWTEAARMGIDAISHAAPWSADLLAADERAGYPQTIFGRVYWLENLDLSSEAVRELIGALRATHVTIDPTLIAIRTKFWGNDPRYTHSPDAALAPSSDRFGWPAGSFTKDWTAAQYRQAQKAWPKLLAFVKLLFDSGVPLTVGTDTPSPWIVPGASFHEELRLLNEAGIPVSEVLRMATQGGAAALRHGGEFGLVRVGMRADLVVLRGNPLEDLGATRQIERVFLAGVGYDPEKILAGTSDQPLR
jgi:imidazolonepropionase-like amidohydrolase